MQKYGVIDLGTNTFHLLIAEAHADGKVVEHYRHRIYVKLAEDGIERIGPAPFKRASSALREFKAILQHHNVTNVRAFGTAALRTASNAAELISLIKESTGISVEIIPGQEEARLIHLGVIQATSFDSENGLIMDIGGGSVEFILANNERVIWAESFPIGVAVLSRHFHQEDPIPPVSMKSMISHLDNILLPLRKILQQHSVTRIIGASGTFDVLEAILAEAPEETLSTTFSADLFHPLCKKLVSSTLEQRFAMDSIPNNRAEMIVVALLLIDYILQITKSPLITVSAYAMKEGMLMEMVQQDYRI